MADETKRDNGRTHGEYARNGGRLGEADDRLRRLIPLVGDLAHILLAEGGEQTTLKRTPFPRLPRVKL
jgi:hypothetical protein